MPRRARWAPSGSRQLHSTTLAKILSRPHCPGNRLTTCDSPGSCTRSASSAALRARAHEPRRCQDSAHVNHAAVACGRSGFENTIQIHDPMGPQGRLAERERERERSSTLHATINTPLASGTECTLPSAIREARCHALSTRRSHRKWRAAPPPHCRNPTAPTPH